MGGWKSFSTPLKLHLEFKKENGQKPQWENVYICRAENAVNSKKWRKKGLSQ
jgi:hypothetical protein